MPMLALQAVGILVLLADPWAIAAPAETTESPTEVVRTTVDKVLRFLNNPTLKDLPSSSRGGTW